MVLEIKKSKNIHQKNDKISPSGLI